MRSIRQSILVCLLAIGAAGCSVTEFISKPDWVRAPSLPDFGSWFSSENAVEVEELGRAEICNSSGGESFVTFAQNRNALMGWSQDRGVEWALPEGVELPDTPYVIIEFGQRPNGGYGLAVSRRAGMRGKDLLLKATFFEPRQGRWADSEPTSPCVIVSVPPRPYDSVRVIDQNGNVRAGTE